jgi:VanZ family protein
MDLNNLINRTAAPATLLWGLAIGALSLAPLETLPSAPGSDKLHHFISYAALCFPLLVKDMGLARIVLPVAIAYGGLIELIQPYVNRYGEWLDFGANAAGCFIGAGLALLARSIWAKRLD